jgi:hypothetical protein
LGWKRWMAACKASELLQSRQRGRKTQHTFYVSGCIYCIVTCTLLTISHLIDVCVDLDFGPDGFSTQQMLILIFCQSTC